MLINPGDVAEMLQRRATKVKPNKFKTMIQKVGAEETGMMEHKGKTIPKEVKSLADRIRKEDPSRSDEYAYRTAWDIFRSHTSEGKRYPRKSEDSGLKREGGGTGPIEKKGTAMGFFDGFEKAAGKADIGSYLRKLEDWSSKKVKTKTPNWTPESPKAFNQVMKEEMPHVPNWKLKLQHA